MFNFTKFARSAAFAAGLCAAIVTGGMSGNAQAADMGDVDDPIKFAIFEWTGQHITTHVAARILQEMGYKTEFVTAGYLSSGAAVADGNIAVAMEIWDNNLGEFWPRLIGDGKVDIIGETGLDAREGWVYPAHMAEVCPGLPAWDALVSCSESLAVAETYPKGRILAYPADWGRRSADLIAGEGLDLVAVPSGSEGALVAEMAAAVETKSPLVMMFWAPHWSLANIDTGWVEMPENIMEEYSFVQPKTFNGAWPGMKDKWPAAYELLKNFRMTNAVQEPIMDAVDNGGGDLEALTGAWVADNKSVWEPMTKAAMN